MKDDVNDEENKSLQVQNAPAGGTGGNDESIRERNAKQIQRLFSSLR